MMQSLDLLLATRFEPILGAANMAFKLEPWQQLAVVLGGIVVLLLLIIKAKLHPFVTLILVSALIGLTAGMAPESVLDSIKNGMGTLRHSGLQAIFDGISSLDEVVKETVLEE